jgi:hypothetical protein
MANTYVKIASVDVGILGAATIDFTSIPSTYTDLVVKVSGRAAGATDFGSLLLALNSSGTGFTNRQLVGTGSAAVSNTGTTAVGPIPGTLVTASTFNNAEIYLPNYAGSSNKSYSYDSVLENNATGARTILGAGLWSNTAAITSISLTTDSGNFVQYSTATLYGILKS